jgi:hypothetical protein
VAGFSDDSTLSGVGVGVCSFFVDHDLADCGFHCSALVGKGDSPL